MACVVMITHTRLSRGSILCHSASQASVASLIGSSPAEMESAIFFARKALPLPSPP